MAKKEITYTEAMNEIEQILDRFRREEMEKWKNVGRNDPCPCGSGKKAKNCCWSKRP